MIYLERELNAKITWDRESSLFSGKSIYFLSLRNFSVNKASYFFSWCKHLPSIFIDKFVMCKPCLKPLEYRVCFRAYKHNNGPPRQIVMCIPFQPSIKREEKSFCTQPQKPQWDWHEQWTAIKTLTLHCSLFFTFYWFNFLQVCQRANLRCFLPLYSWELSCIQLQIKLNISMHCLITNLHFLSSLSLEWQHSFYLLNTRVMK